MSKSTPNFIGRVSTGDGVSIDVSYQDNSDTFPENAGEGDTLLVTIDGTSNTAIKEEWIYDGTNWTQTKGATKVSGSILDNTIADSNLINVVGKYIVPATGTANAFVGQENKYAEWAGAINNDLPTGFVFSTPMDNSLVSIANGVNANQVWRFTTANGWKQEASSGTDLIIPAYVSGKAYPFNSMTRTNTGEIVVAQGDIQEGSPFTLHKLTTATTLRTSGTSSIIFDLIFDSKKWIGVTSSSQVITSTDGITWEVKTIGLGGQFNSIAHYITPTGSIVLIIVTSTGEIYKSNGGSTWFSRTNPTSSGLRRVKYIGGRFIAVGNNGLILTSTDEGTTWVQRTSNTPQDLRGIAFKSGLYVAVGDAGTIVTSPDAITWTVRSSGTTVQLTCVASNSTTFVVGMYNGGTRTSTDGITWSARSTTSSSIVMNINHNGSYFIIVSDIGQIQTSVDGVTWVLNGRPVTSAFRAIGVTDQKYLAVGDSGRIAEVYTGNGWLPIKPSSPKVSIYSGNSGQTYFTASATNYATSTTKLKLVGTNITTKFVDKITVQELGLTIQQSGLYEIKLEGSVFDLGTSYTPMVFFIGVNGAEIAGSKITVTSGGNIPFTLSIVHQLSTGDNIDFRFASTNNEGLLISNCHVTVREF